jgi:transposase
VVGRGSEGATALFDMPGFVVRVHAMKAGEWWLQVETTADRVGCRSCGVRAVGRGRRRVEVRDLPIAGRPVGLVWAKRVWRCVESLCATATWTEQDAEIGSRASLTRRARIEICRRVGEDADSVAQVARQFGVGWHTAMAAVREHGERLVDNPERLGAPAALGLDETSFLRAGPKHPTVMITGSSTSTATSSSMSLRVVLARSFATGSTNNQPHGFRRSMSRSSTRSAGMRPA